MEKPVIHPQFNDSSPAQTSDGSSVITTKIVEIEPLVYFKLLTMFIGVSMGKLLSIYMLILVPFDKITHWNLNIHAIPISSTQLWGVH